MESVIAEKYAVALLQVARDKKTVDVILSEILAIQKIVAFNDKLKLILEHPRKKAAEKLNALREVLTQELSQTMENFLMLLILEKRIQHLSAVAEDFERLCYEMKGKAIARVLSASPFNASQKQDLTQKLSKMFGVAVELREEVKPGLLGGAIIYLGDQRMDGSVLGQLERMKQSLLKIETD